MNRKLTLLLLALLGILSARAQDFAVKTNLLYDIGTTANLGVEFPVAPRWTIDVSGNLQAWNVNDHRLRHWLVQPEARYWLCDTFQGHFFAGHLTGGQFNVGNISNSIHFLGTDFSLLSDRRYQGWFAGAGIGYGYSWILAKHWNIEAEIAVGWTYSRSDVYPCAECGTRIQDDKVHNYVGPTKAAVDLIYIF